MSRWEVRDIQDDRFADKPIERDLIDGPSRLAFRSRRIVPRRIDVRARVGRCMDEFTGKTKAVRKRSSGNIEHTLPHRGAVLMGDLLDLRRVGFARSWFARMA